MSDITVPVTAPEQALQLAPHQIVLRPLVTEKGIHRANRNNQYYFEVNPLASKPDVAKAVAVLFDVKVLKVRTQNRKGKPRRHRLRRGYTKGWKKAIVTLHEDSKINLF